MQTYYADFHIHIGISETGRWVKIPTSNRLTLRNILAEAAQRKGMNIIGIVDALSPLVRDDLDRLLTEGLLTLDSQGGYHYGDSLTLLLGAEIETTEPEGGTAHTLVYLPDAYTMGKFADTMANHIRNINLSSQNAHMPLAQLVKIAAAFEAAIVPAHVFTPHKSLYGACTKRLTDILGDREIGALTAIELGLSADTEMADTIAELAELTYLSNSDAHSLDKIAREYNVLSLDKPTFQECVFAFKRQHDRRVIANFGLDPRLGKYHHTFCPACNYTEPRDGDSLERCPQCGNKKIINGVAGRIKTIADYTAARHPAHRPLYHHQIPLGFIPGLGEKAMDKLLATYGTEMAIIHKADIKQIEETVGEKLAAAIQRASAGQAEIVTGGGGIYGKLAKN
jgi:uncharacterized protein (TIGR00375 family)